MFRIGCFSEPKRGILNTNRKTKVSLKKVCEPPGPKAKEWVKRDSAVLSPYNRPYYYPMVVEKGHGCIVEDVDGNEYVDFNSGLGAMNVGHCHPEVVKAISDQSKRLLHYSYTDFYYRYAVELGEKLQKITPGSFQKKVFLSGSGAESIEAFAKVARWHSKRPQFLAFTGAFHGRSMGALSFTASSIGQKARYFPTMPGVEHVPYAYCYRCPYKLDFPGCDYWCVDFIDDWVLKKFLPPEEVAASLIEPIQGEGGYIVPPKGFLPMLKKIAEKYGILFIDDEIQAGMGRTGKMWAIEHFGVVPDIITTAKALGAGIPIGATIIDSKLDFDRQGRHSNTFGGNPIGAAAALAVLEIIDKEKLLERTQKLGRKSIKRLREMQDEYDIIGDTRGLGLMLAHEFVKDKKSRDINKEARDRIVELALKKGVGVIGCGKSSIRYIPPLTIEEDLLDKAWDILEECIKTVDKG